MRAPLQAVKVANTLSPESLVNSMSMIIVAAGCLHFAYALHSAQCDFCFIIIEFSSNFFFSLFCKHLCKHNSNC